MDIYLHGIETIERNDGPRPVETIDTGIIGMVFTAPDADATIWPLNKCVPVYGYMGFPSGLGENGTGPDAFEAIFAQASRASATVVGVRVEQGGTPAATRANVLGSSLLKTGMHALRDAQTELGLKPKLLIAPGFTSERPTDGIKSIAVTDGGEDYTSAPDVVITGTGTGATAVAVINSETGEVTEIVVTNPGSGYSAAPTISFTGGGGGSGATATATLGTVANPVTVELLSLANRLRACVIADGPNTTSAAAVGYRQDYSSDRLLIVDPFVKVAKGESFPAMPASGFVAGLQARVDYDEGFWYSPSNHVINGIVGPARVVEHSLSDPSAESQYLNKNAVATIVRSPSGGFKLWGSRVPSGDTLNLFWSVRRSHDTIIESVERAHEPFIDKPFRPQHLIDIAETVNAALARWVGLGASLGKRVWFDRALNTALTWANGHLYVSYDAEGPAPIEHITFVFNRNTGYYERLSQDVLREIERMATASL